MKRWLLLIGRLGLGGIFLYAGYVKGIQEPWLQFAVSLETWKLLPETWLEPVARTLPWVEMALGLATISGFLARWFSLILTGMLGFFVGLGAWAYATGRQVDCGCFGSGGGGLGPTWFAEHAAMLTLGLAVTIGYFMAAHKRTPAFGMRPGSEAAPGAVAGD
jgi:uncharacterized membrane protein YphA (DoxX/SURF4 family)